MRAWVIIHTDDTERPSLVVEVNNKDDLGRVTLDVMAELHRIWRETDVDDDAALDQHVQG